MILGKGIKLPPFCLYELVKSIESKDSILIYSDNDKIVEGKRTHPHFKPDFGRETITSWNYIGKLIAVKTTFLKAHEEVFEKLGENMIYDLIFRISEKTRKIEHISKVLYHEIKETKVNEEDEIKIIEKHLKRVNLPYNSVKRGKYKGQYKVDYKIKGKPLVSLVVPNKDLIEDLEKLINSLNKSTYTNYEVVITMRKFKRKTKK